MKKNKKKREEKLIEQYNRNRSIDKHVKTIEEMNRKLLDEEIINLKNKSNG